MSEVDRRLSLGEKKMILNVYASLAEDHPDLNKTKLADKCAAYTGRSVRSVQRVLSEMRKNNAVKPPKVAKREDIIVLDDHQKYLIRKTVHKFFFENRLPTLDMVHAEIKHNDEIPSMSRSKLYKVLKELNFKYCKRGRKSVLLDKDNIINWRRKYLRQIKELRKQGRPIYYLDETWLNASHTKSKIWIDQTILSRRQAFNEGLSTGLSNPTGKGKRMIILHIGNENGFVNNGLLLFEGVKTGDYHEEMNANKFENWFKNILNDLPQNAVIVMDNAPYHSRVLEKWPNTSWKKQNIQEFLNLKHIKFCPNALKIELLQLVKMHKPQYPVYVVDEMAAKCNKLVLRLPPYHCELNPIELIWAQIKNYVAAKNTTFQFDNVKSWLQEGINNVTPSCWEKCVKHVISEECKMWELDGLIENAVEPLIIELNNNSSESDTSFTEYFDSD